jgi:hypothetical protein
MPQPWPLRRLLPKAIAMSSRLHFERLSGRLLSQAVRDASAALLRALVPTSSMNFARPGIDDVQDKRKLLGQ